ncbi:putative RuBisCO transcriptional regulator [Actinoplanes sp. SE50]|uniref:LysR family transcriptional regulator n=1 Tax=unclassified Actinoplanes TaxID=2626549 RepID=UPI00023ECA14|nr:MULTISPECIES: LysR family transcriptional regulator [unclassified Actinoplanes]AEV87099.1 putative RuBisCO transcriptional regulator [Actinoplanes sp. SE50/110]ATO85497.1 putative RuBisCO transcriptional regulator [Actinoplanes sp. SE50]SLM02909.1 LysR-family transcriptional regulator [Actinoplanes sp. SE50/110]
MRPDGGEPEHVALNWGDLMAFQRLAAELNFTRAAARLSITQPALSVRIRRLEQSVGARLLDRSTRVVRLTTAGRLLKAWTDHAARSWTEVQKMMVDPPEPASGTATAVNRLPCRAV